MLRFIKPYAATLASYFIDRLLVPPAARWESA